MVMILIRGKRLTIEGSPDGPVLSGDLPEALELHDAIGDPEGEYIPDPLRWRAEELIRRMGEGRIISLDPPDPLPEGVLA
jgi:hypothetical protein